MEDITGLSAGTYSVTVTDANNCTASLLNIDITSPSALTIPGLVTQINCGGVNSGGIDVTPSGGTPGYLYAWTGPSSYTNTTQDISTLGPGTYNLTVTDANQCSLTGNWTINPGPQALQLSQTNVDVLCTGQSTGSIDLTVVGGTGPYTYAWTGPGAYTANTQDIINLAIGNYSVVVTDAAGCTTTLSSIAITSPASAMSLSQTNVDVLCAGQSTGSINLSVSGGTPLVGGSPASPRQFAGGPCQYQNRAGYFHPGRSFPWPEPAAPT